MGHDSGMSFSGVTYKDTVHDTILVNRLVYWRHEPKRGDIIVFTAPKKADFEHGHTVENILTKRVIGAPGDTIEIKGGKVWRNGKPLDEPYIKEPMEDPQPLSATYGVDRPLKLGQNEYYVLGDNRNHSNDSRFWGVVTRNRIIGKVTAIIAPYERQRSFP